MRALLLALMIALLPLRGWVGDAMAVDMMGEALLATSNAIKSVVFNAHPAVHSGHFDTHHAACAELTAADPTGDTVGSPDANCTSHAACQLCHSMALAPLPLMLASLAGPAGTPPLAQAAFMSAEPTRDFKPPIA